MVACEWVVCVGGGGRVYADVHVHNQCVTCFFVVFLCEPKTNFCSGLCLIQTRVSYVKSVLL